MRQKAKNTILRVMGDADWQFREKSIGQYAHVDEGDADSDRAGSAASLPHGPKGFLRPHETMDIYRRLPQTFPYFFRTNGRQ